MGKIPCICQGDRVYCHCGWYCNARPQFFVGETYTIDWIDKSTVGIKADDRIAFAINLSHFSKHFYDTVQTRKLKLKKIHESWG